MRKLITPHLSIAETKCKCGCGLGTHWFIDSYTTYFFEAIRTACGNQPLVINCGWRCSSHNKAVKGNVKSPHLKGIALDIGNPKWMAITEFWNICGDIVEDGGLGRYVWGCHIDCGHIIGLKKHRRWTDGV